MLTRCLSCHAAFPTNETLEHFRSGRRVAFDPQRGRLWAICDACRRWTPAPIEERWEALEELERLTTDRARLLSQTENIALLRAEEIEIVRVGRAKLVEEAWWRYGREMQFRRRRSSALAGLQVAAVLGLVVATGGSALWAFWGGDNLFVNLARWAQFGRTVWRGETFCSRCGGVLTEFRFDRARHLILLPGEEEGITLQLGCKRCGLTQRDAGYQLRGVGAEHLLRRVMAYQNFQGASERRVKEATGAIEQVGSPAALVRQLARERTKLRSLHRRDRRMHAIALEIAVNDETERRLLELELRELEARWREEEEIAAIVDSELTPVPMLDALIRRIGRLSS